MKFVTVARVATPTLLDNAKYDVLRELYEAAMKELEQTGARLTMIRIEITGTQQESEHGR